MKGVVVQVGEPKSIILFNNGKIRAIPTPADCHVGMVVSVRLNDRLKIIAIVLGAVFLLAVGIVIGAAFRQTRLASSGAAVGAPMMMGHGRGNMRQIQTITVSQAASLRDDTEVVLTGRIARSLGDEKYTFRDSTGDIVVEIDRKLWRNLNLSETDRVEISGEIDADRNRVEIDVKTIKKL